MSNAILDPRIKNELLKENATLKNRTEHAQVRNSLLKAKLSIIEKEIKALNQKAIKSQPNLTSRLELEKGLYTALDDQTNTKRDLDGEKFRQDVLNKQIPLLKSQLKIFEATEQDEEIIKDSIKTQICNLKKQIDFEEVLEHQVIMKFLEEISSNRNEHDEKHNNLQKLEDDLQNKYTAIQGMLDEFHLQQAAKKEKKLNVVGIADALDLREPQNEEEEENVPEESADNEETNRKAQLKKILIEISKYQTLYDIAKMDTEHLQKLVEVLGRRISEMNEFHKVSRELYFKAEEQVKELEIHIARIDTAIKQKRKAKIWEKSRKLSDLTIPAISEKQRLLKNAAIMKEENDMLRKYLLNILEAKEDEYGLYSELSEQLEKRLADSVKDIKIYFDIPDDEDKEKKDEDEEKKEAEDEEKKEAEDKDDNEEASNDT